MEKIKALNSLFSTADAEDVSYSSDGYELILKFRDWQGRQYVVIFDDVEFLKITDKINYDVFSDDSPYEIINSSLIKELNIENNNYHHYMLCFNAWSNIEIISNKMVIQP